MAQRLNWRGAAAAALVIAVLAVHGCVVSRVAELMAGFGEIQAMPRHIEVAYVREMPPSPPPPVAVQPPRVAPAPKPSAPTVLPAAPAASAAAAREEPPESISEPPQDPFEDTLGSVPPGPPQAAASASQAEFEWPVSTRLSYVLSGNFRGEIHGTAQVDWVRVGRHYQVNMEVIVGLPFAPLMSRHMTSEGTLTPTGLAPQRYDEDSKFGFGERRRWTILLRPDVVVLPNGRRHERWPGMQDAVSQFVQLTYLFTTQPKLFVTGATIEVPLALPRQVHRWPYDVMGTETLTTPFGLVDGVHLKPRRPARRGSDLTAEMWLAPSLHYLPARIRIQQDAETYIDLMLKRRPQLAAR